MPVRILIIAFLLFILWRLASRDVMRLFRKVSPAPRNLNAIDTVQCPRCNAYVPKDIKHTCDYNGKAE